MWCSNRFGKTGILLCLALFLLSFGSERIAFAASSVTLVSVKISGAASVVGGKVAFYTATATFSDHSTQDVTDTATWSVTSSYAAISAGTLTTEAVTKKQHVTITATYSSGGKTKIGKKNVGITPVTLSSLAVSGPNTVVGGNTASYTATATLSDGSVENVTTEATWSDNSPYAVISEGTLTTQAVSKTQFVVIKVRYTAGGVSKTVTKSVTITPSNPAVSLSSVAVTGPASVVGGNTASYIATATFSDTSTQNVTIGASWSDDSSYATISTGTLTTSVVPTDQTVTLTAGYTFGGITKTGTLVITITVVPPVGSKSINSTSQNRATLPTSAVAEQIFTTNSGFQIFAVNDLGMHCGDIDHRIASILPPFNVMYSIVIQKGTASLSPVWLASSDVDVIYSAASSSTDPALQLATAAPIYKTDFWDPNPVSPGTSLAFDGFNPFYPPNTLSLFTLNADMGLPTPDLGQLFPVSGTGALVAAQQEMPGITAPYTANVPQSFAHFDTEFPFFVNFPFGYRLTGTGMSRFSADGIPMAPVDDFGRSNYYPLMRVQAKTRTAALTGTAGAVISSMDTVVPVSGETNCYKCHTSSADGGSGYAACISGVDTGCTTTGSPRSNTAFVVARISDDTSTYPTAVKREWAADNNIIRLHDAKNGTTLQNSTPIVCQKCHYTPALDLAHVGPLGPADAAANGRDQRVHHTNSRAVHTWHSQFTDLFDSTMPPPNDAQRIDPATGKPVVNALVQTKLNNSCYRCHPGATTKCLRGAMFNGGLICQDCHGTMAQIGNDFSANFSVATPYPAGADLTKRVPWANVPACQSCHTGDAMSNLTATAGVIPSSDGIRLLQAYKTTDTTATPITATNKRFAESTSGSNRVLFRLDRDANTHVFCQACHGSTHAEWPVQPTSGTYTANDNQAAVQAQGHAGKIMECTACHAAGSLPVSLGGPHGMHPVNDSHFMSSHDDFVETVGKDACRACHGATGLGTVLSAVPVARTLHGHSVAAGTQIPCTLCHENQL